MTFRVVSLSLILSAFSLGLVQAKPTPQSIRLDFAHSTPAQILAAYDYFQQFNMNNCDFANAMLNVVFPRGESHASWPIPSDEAQLQNYNLARQIVYNMEELQDSACAVKNNAKCCREAAIENCIPNKTRNCNMDATNLWCKHGSHKCPRRSESGNVTTEGNNDLTHGYVPFLDVELLGKH